ncbi:hypothetical protein PIROE2DRAFT_58694 [Piromyces sp. E2]|nr:hypothetical protein PIROE2DRAFT_58694 [Piromyces sp. E2]|eukprot:OUM67557.1 hypothetical protein PIROE2DRAFT_58694 [Piromyces sp. E2]
MEALKHALKGFRLAINYKNKDLIINSILFMWGIMEFWLNVCREFSYLFYNLLKSFDDAITEMNFENKKWIMFIKYELTKCLLDIKKYNYNLQKLKLKNIGQNNMDIDFDVNDNSIFPENSYLKHILNSLYEDQRLLLYLLIQKTLEVLPTGDSTNLIMKYFMDISSLAKMYDLQRFPDFLELYIKFILNNFKYPEAKNYIKSIIKEFKINENEKIYISLIKCEKKLPLKPEKIDKLYKKIIKYNTYIIENEEEGQYITLENYKWSSQNYLMHLAELAVQSKNYMKAKEILNEMKFTGYIDKSILLNKSLLTIYVELEEHLANPSLVLLSSSSIDFQFKKLKKIKELIVTYEKQDGDENNIQKAIQNMWNYMFPLLQQSSFQKEEVTVEERLYLKVEEIHKSHNSIPDEELENILKIYLYDFTNIKRIMDVEEIIQKSYVKENYKMRYIKEINTDSRCETTMMALLKIIDLAFKRKIYSVAFDVASIIIFNEWKSSFCKLDYFKISMAHVSHIRAYIILHYWKLFKNKQQQQQQKSIYYNDKCYDNLFNMKNDKTLNSDNHNNNYITSKIVKSSSKIPEEEEMNPSEKFSDYYNSRKDSLPYKEKLMEDVIRSINIGLELNKTWIVNNSASIIYDFILIQSKTIINGNKDCLFMGYFNEIKILHEKLKQSNETSSLLYIYISAIFMQANIESIEYELYGEIKITNDQRKVLEGRSNGIKKQDLNSNFASVREIYNFFTSSNLKLDNYTSMTISNLWMRYKLAKADEENSMKDIDKNTLFPIDILENVKVSSSSDYQKKIYDITNKYLEMENNITLSNWVESLVRIGRCALKENMLIHAYKCFSNALKIKIPTTIDSPSYKNKYDANICFYWTSIGYFEYSNVYQKFIEINNIITNIQSMHIDSINYLVESTKYLRHQSNVSYELFLEIAKRAWNISIKLLNYKSSYKQLEKVLYEFVFVTNKLTTEIKTFKEHFKDPDNEIVNIFTHIFSLLMELNLLNKNWTSGLHVISKLNALLPKKIDSNCYYEKLQFFHHTHNEMGLNSVFIIKPELQLFYWTNIACKGDTGIEEKEKAYQNCINLCENDSYKKAEYLIKYIDWMYSNHKYKDKYLEYLTEVWNLIDSSIITRVKSTYDINENPIYIDENKQYSVYQTELLVRSFILYLSIYHTKKNTINCILTIYTLLNNLIINTHKAAIQLQNDYKRKKGMKINNSENNETGENENEEEDSPKEKSKNKKEKKKQIKRN